MRVLRWLCFGATMVAATATLAGAQEARLVELGIDGGLAMTLDDPKVTTISLPGGAFRVGFFMSPQVSIEPVVSFNYANIDDVGSGSTFTADVGLLYHFSPDRTSTQLYGRPFVGLVRESVTFDDFGFGEESESNSRFNAGVGLGVKLPWRDRFAVRFEGNLTRFFEDGDIPAQNALGITVGLSFFTR